MMRPDAKVEKVYLYPKPVDFRKSIDGLAALVELDIKAAVFDSVLFVFLNRSRNRVKILYWERNGFCLWLKRLEAERFKSHPEPGEEAIVLTAQELNWLLDGIDLWRNTSRILRMDSHDLYTLGKVQDSQLTLPRCDLTNLSAGFAILLPIARHSCGVWQWAELHLFI